MPQTADLTLCDREPITRLDQVQDFGFLIALSTDWTVVRASANLGEHLGIEAEAAIGLPLGRLLSRAAQHDIRNRMSMLDTTGSERLYALKLMPGRKLFDLSLHFADDLLVIEGEPARTESGAEAASMVRAMAARLAKTTSLDLFHRDAARQVRAITGFDRVMIYCFDTSGAGEVIAESTQSGVEGYFGLHFPAADIPVQARSLYLRNTFRIIADIAAVPVPVLPLASASQAPLDLSMSITRAVSPVHLEYLANMGVAASMSISIIVEGELWGLVACHHHSPRLPSFIARTAAELFGSMYSMMLESRARLSHADEERRSHLFAEHLITEVAADPELLTDPRWLQDIFRETIDSDGIAVQRGGEVFTHGDTPGHDGVKALARLVDAASPNRIFCTDALTAVCPTIEARDVAGVLAIPISRTLGDYIMLFRQERTRSIEWGGDPTKAAAPGGASQRLSPRKSFEAFVETIRGRSLPFADLDRRVAEAVRQAIILRLTETAEDDRRRASKRQELLIAELNHRVRNILALIRSLVSQTGTDAADVASYVAALSGRVQSLARAHDQATHQNWGPSLLGALFDNEIAAHAQAHGRIVVHGDPVLLKPQAISTMALVIHELVTNSVKYGALSGDGTVDVALELVPGDGLHMRWRERGGPAVQPPTRRGFGSVIVERTIPYDLAGRAAIRFAPDGLEADFVVPEIHLGESRTGQSRFAQLPPRTRAPGPMSGRPLEGMQVLLLEDNMIIAIEAEDMLEWLGASRVITASSMAEADAAADDPNLRFAMLDINIGGTTSFAFAKRLQARGIPFIFASGYGDQLALDPDHASVVVVQKPYERSHLERAIETVLQAPALP